MFQEMNVSRDACFVATDRTHGTLTPYPMSTSDLCQAFLWREHSVEDHYLHTKYLRNQFFFFFFFFLGGGRPPGSPACKPGHLSFTVSSL